MYKIVADDALYRQTSENKKSFSYKEMVCSSCSYRCSQKCDWMKHILTKKHIRLTNNILTNNSNKKHKCKCGKEYIHLCSLCKHRKNCTFKIDETIIEDKTEKVSPLNTNEMVMKLLEQNTELQKQIIELSKQPTIVNNTQNINNTTNNNQFNLSLFLNETCKDALNIDDFMNSLHLTVDDLKETGRLGFVQGITRIFLQGLKDLDVTRRPFHCTDIKRETVYIKDQDKWEKETTEKKLMKQALNQVVRKNLKMIHVWREDHPDYLRSNTKDNDDYMKIYLSSLGSEYDDEQQRMDEKIIRNVLREIMLDKKPN
jgi:hypothetical protein